MKRVLLFVLLIYHLAPAAQENWKTSPMYFEITTQAGDTLTRTFTVYNESDQAKQFEIYAKDWTIEPDGNEPEFEPGEFELGCAGWITFSPQVLSIPPASSQQVRVTMIVPETVGSGNYWGALYVQAMEKQLAGQMGQRGQSMRMFVSLRNRVAFVMTIKGSEPLVREGVIDNVTARVGPDKKLNITAQFKNTGNMMLKCTGTVEIRDSMGETVTKFPFKDFYCMVDNSRKLNVEQDIYLKTGVYTALVIVDFNGDYLVAGEALFDVY